MSAMPAAFLHSGPKPHIPQSAGHPLSLSSLLSEVMPVTPMLGGRPGTWQHVVLTSYLKTQRNLGLSHMRGPVQVRFRSGSGRGCPSTRAGTPSPLPPPSQWHNGRTGNKAHRQVHQAYHPPVLPVVSFLEVPGQLALGQNVMKWGLRTIICCKNRNTANLEPPKQGNTQRLQWKTPLKTSLTGAPGWL